MAENDSDKKTVTEQEEEEEKFIELVEKPKRRRNEDEEVEAPEKKKQRLVSDLKPQEIHYDEVVCFPVAAPNQNNVVNMGTPMPQAPNGTAGAVPSAAEARDAFYYVGNLLEATGSAQSVREAMHYTGDIIHELVNNGAPGFGVAAVNAAIAAACAPGGAITKVVNDAITAACEEGGAIANAIKAACAPGGTVTNTVNGAITAACEEGGAIANAIKAACAPGGTVTSTVNGAITAACKNEGIITNTLHSILLADAANPVGALRHAARAEIQSSFSPTGAISIRLNNFRNAQGSLSAIHFPPDEMGAVPPAPLPTTVDELRTLDEATTDALLNHYHITPAGTLEQRRETLAQAIGLPQKFL